MPGITDAAHLRNRIPEATARRRVTVSYAPRDILGGGVRCATDDLEAAVAALTDAGLAVTGHDTRGSVTRLSVRDAADVRLAG